MRIVCTIAKAAYGYVGGTQDNHVVQALVSFFCDAGLHVATYDARGVGSSGGKMTWTMRAESRDYQAVVDAMAARVETHGTPELYLCVCRSSHAGIQRGCDPVRCETHPERRRPKRRKAGKRPRYATSCSPTPSVYAGP